MVSPLRFTFCCQSDVAYSNGSLMNIKISMVWYPNCFATGNMKSSTPGSLISKKRNSLEKIRLHPSAWLHSDSRLPNSASEESSPVPFPEDIRFISVSRASGPFA